MEGPGLDELEMFAQAPIPLVVIDPAARVVMANRAWQRATGCDPIGQPAEAHLAPEVVDEACDAMATQREGLVNETSLNREAEDRAFRARIQPVLGGDHVTGAVIAYEDMGSELVAERELHRARRLIPLAAHELQTPLMTLLLWERLLRDGSLPSHEHAGALDAIERSAQAMSQLVGELVDVTRAAAGMLEIDTTEVELGPLVDAALDRARGRAAAGEITLDATVAPELGTVTGNALRLEQILDTLLATAVRFAHRRVTLDARGDADGVELAVAHDGRGIARAWLPRAFEPFAQLDDAEPRTGAGLGLARIDALVALHGGSVTADSDGRDHGATFTVRLPRLFSRG